MAATIGSSPTPSNESGSSCFNVLFAAYSKFGDTRSDGSLITLSNSDKWMKAAGIIPTSIKPNKGPKDPISFSATDTGIEYKKIAKSRKSIDRGEYDNFLLSLIGKNIPASDADAESKKKKLLVELKEKLIKAGPPKLNLGGSTSARAGSASSSASAGGASRPATGSAKVDSVVARLTDHTKYTGSHKLRFDDDGKGKGKAGRI